MHQNKRIIMWLNDQYGEGNENVKVVIEALEKQIAKKPIDKLMYIECPACGDVGIEDCAYCPVCGQKLDWSEV